MKTTKTIIAAALLTIYLFSMIEFISALTLNSVDVSPSEVQPGKTFEILVRIENNDDTDLNDVSVSLNLKDLPFSSNALEINYDEILEDKSKTADFNLRAFDNAQSGDYQIPIQVTYEDPDDSTKTKTKNSIANIKVISEPNVDVEVGDNYLIEGQEGKITVKVINRGISNVKFLEVRIDSISKASLLSSNRVYIGDLNSDDFDTAEFSVILKTSATGSSTSINVPVTLIYRDVFNKEYTKYFDENIKVYSRQEATKLGLIKANNTIYYILIVIVLIIIYLVYRRIRKRRRMKKENNM